jgi:cation transport ATPase
LRQRLVKYWRVWLTIAVVAVVGNEFVDRDVAGDKNGHPFGDFLVAVVLVGIVFYVSWFVGRNRSRRQAP